MKQLLSIDILKVIKEVVMQILHRFLTHHDFCLTIVTFDIMIIILLIDLAFLQKEFCFFIYAFQLNNIDHHVKMDIEMESMAK